MDLPRSSLSFLRLKVRPSLIGITRGTYVVVRSMRPPALRRITLLVMKSDWFRSALATLQPMLTGITGGRCEPCGRCLSASNLFDRIEHAAPFVSAHDTISEEAPSQAWSGKRRMCSPGLACDPSSVCTRASTARLTAAVQGLQGPGSRPVPLRVAHDPDRPTADLRPTLRCETTLTWRCELRAAASTWLRRARAFACLACASRGWPGSIPKASSDLRSGPGVWTPMAVLLGSTRIHHPRPCTQHGAYLAGLRAAYLQTHA